ncbi:PRTRC system protein E [Pseudomonas aeruginosa]|uniref:PRTRC system protein E n=1 Tax=Pseudomonas aeruginosa TaxID=287 RepID=UPI002E2E43A9|nr:PRTRC system protein E [Pseudomonas aeruginosa]
MSHTFFTAVSQAVAMSKQRINVDIEGLGDGRIKVLLSANLGPTPENASASEVQLRAALAKPLLVSGTPEEVEEALHERVKAHAAVINEGASLLEQIRSLGAKAMAERKGGAPATAAQPEEEDDDVEEERGDSKPVAQQTTPAPAAPAAFDSLAELF